MGGRKMKAPTQPKKDDFSTVAAKAYDGHKRKSLSPRVDLRDRGSLLAMLSSGTVAHACSLNHVQVARAWATLSRMIAAPMLLAQRPPLHEICEAGIAIVPIGEHWSIGATASSMNFAAPLLLLARPISLPIRKAVRTVERVDGAQGRRCRRNHFFAPDALELTAASLLSWTPFILPIECVDFTLIHWPDAPNHGQQTEQEGQDGAKQAREVPPAWYSAEVAAVTHEPVRGVCYVSSLPATDKCQVAIRAHASIATNATCSAVITWSHTSHRDGLNHHEKQPTTCD